ncbi:hypothetical protein [Eubacterium ramulus]|uniref:hypothetical protein n=1 Tax=Eubacterium ramulus TaxID=39490 RepID=UPI00300EBE28
MSENNDFIQLPPLKKDTPADVVAFMWEYMKVPENSREKVKNLLKDANENGVKLSHQAPTLYDVVPKEEITEFEELMRKTIADIVSEASSIACWVYVQKYVKQKTLDEMLQELPGAGQDFVYSDEEISPIGNKITIYSGDGLGDTEVVLKPISVKEENAYEPTYLTPGMPVEMDVEKGAWFKVGINMQNNTDTDKIVYVEIEGVEVRIE